MSKLTDASKANKSGQALEKKLKKFLIKNDFAFKQQKHGKSDIDFIIGSGENTIYADCTNQNVKGSVDEKLPHKIWKYHKKYDYSEVYIIRGKHVPKDNIFEHCEEICREKRFHVHIVTFEEFCDILLDKEIVGPLSQFIR